MNRAHARANCGRHLPLRIPGVTGRGPLWPRLLPPSELPRRGVVVRLVLALVLATALWAGVTAQQDPVRLVTYSAVPITVRSARGYSPVTSLPAATIRVQGLSSDLQDAPRPTAFVDATHGTSRAERVQVSGVHPRLQLVSVTPRTVRVQLEKAAAKTGIPVQPTGFGPPPPGYLEPRFSSTPSTLTIVGPAHLVNRVVAARLALNDAQFTQNTSLVVVPQLFDSAGRGVSRSGIQLFPPKVTVMVTVRHQPYAQPMPIQPVITGTLAAGYAITNIAYFPQFVQVVSGVQLARARLTTAPITVAGWRKSHTVLAQIEVPAGVTLNRTQVTVTIEVSPIPGSAVSTAQVLVVGERRGTRATLDRSTVTVVYQGLLPLLHRAGAPVAILDVHNRRPGVYDLRPTITLAPGLRLSALTPPRLRVTITAAR
jgi:YbbR domain-containing protein